MARRRAKKRRRTPKKYTGIFSSIEKRMDETGSDAFPSKKEIGFWTGMVIILFLFTSGIFAIFKDTPEAAFAGNMYSLLLIVAGIIGGLSLVFWVIQRTYKNAPFLFWAPFTNGNKAALGVSYRIWAMLGGVGFSVLFLLGSLSVGIPLFLFALATWQTVIFVTVLAPFIEEFMFRCGCFPTLRQNFNWAFGRPWGTIIAFLIINAAWALFHYSVLSANIETTFFIFLIGMFYTAGNVLFKDSAFSLSAHVTNNVWYIVITLGLIVVAT